MTNTALAEAPSSRYPFSPTEARAVIAFVAALEKLGGRAVRPDKARNAAHPVLEAMPIEYRRTLRSRVSKHLHTLEDAGVIAVEWEQRKAGSVASLKGAESVELAVEIVLVAAVPDAVVETANTPKDKHDNTGGQLLRTPARTDVVRALHAVGGSVGSSSGQATAVLARGMNPVPSTLSSVVRRLEEEGIVDRDVNGKRVYRIALTDSFPREWLADAPDDEPEPVEPEPEEPAPVEEPPAPEPEQDGPIARSPLPVLQLAAEATDLPVAPGAVVEDVAMALLNAAFQAIARGDSVPAAHAQLVADHEVSQRRLVEQTEYAQRWRRKAEEAADLAAARKLEVDSLRSRLRSVEANLEALLRESGRATSAAFRDGLQSALDRFIRERPTAGSHA